MNRFAKYYDTGKVFATLAIILFEVIRAGVNLTNWYWSLILAAAIIPIRRFSIPLIKYSFLTFTFIVCIFSFLVFGFLEAGLIVLLGVTVADTIFLRRGFKRAIGNATSFTLSILISGIVYKHMNGYFGIHSVAAENALPLISFLILLFGLLPITFWLSDILRRGLKLKEVGFIFKWEFIIYLISTLIALFAIVAIHSFGIGSLLIYIPVVLIFLLFMRPVIDESITARSLKTIIELERTISTGLSLEEIIERIRKLSLELVDWSLLQINKVDRKKGETVLIYDSDTGMQDGSLRVKIGEGIIGACVAQGEPILINDVTADKRYICLKETTGSELTIPLKFENEIVGVLNLEYKQKNSFSKKDIEHTSIFAEQLARAIKINETLEPLMISSEKLSESEGKLSVSIQQLDATSDEITANIQKMYEDFKKEKTVEQQRLIFFEKIFDFSKNLSNSSMQVREQSRDIRRFIEEDKKKIESILDTLSEIQNFTKRIRGLVTEFQLAHRKVEEFAEAIRKIAVKTNFLSFNASLEAARAGESGRGFTLVANEINRLAEDSRESSSNITHTIQGISKEIENIIAAIKEVEKKIGNVADISTPTMQAFNEILKSVNETIPLIENNAALARNHVEGVETSVRQMRQSIEMVERNAKSAEGVVHSISTQNFSIEAISEHTRELSEISKELKRVISEFRIG